MEPKVNWVTLDGRPLNFTKWHDEDTGVTHVKIERDWPPLVISNDIDDLLRAVKIDLA